MPSYRNTSTRWRRLHPDRPLGPELGTPLGREHHEDQEDQQDPGGDGEHAERCEQLHERVALGVRGLEAIRLDLLRRQAERRRARGERPDGGGRSPPLIDPPRFDTSTYLIVPAGRAVAAPCASGSSTAPVAAAALEVDDASRTVTGTACRRCRAQRDHPAAAPSRRRRRRRGTPAGASSASETACCPCRAGDPAEPGAGVQVGANRVSRGSVSGGSCSAPRHDRDRRASHRRPGSTR